MKKTPLVFSLVREQSVFMTAIMSLLTFLSVLALGVALSIGNGVSKWNSQWDLFATVQIMSPSESDATMQIINDNRNKIVSVKEISTDEMKKLLGPWISGGAKLDNYLPIMYELKFKKKSDIESVGSQISQHAKFLTHASALKNSTDAGRAMIFISTVVLILILASIGICISYIARNTALLHRRELEILNQIGARDSFVAKQMQIIVAKICTVAGAIGFVAATPILLMILSAAHSTRVGLMSMMGLGIFSWILLIIIPIAIVGFSIWITKITTLKLLENN